MKFATFETEGRTRFGFQLREGQLVELPVAAGFLSEAGELSEAERGRLVRPDLKSLLEQGRPASAAAARLRDLLLERDPASLPGLFQEERVRYLPPVPNPGKIMAIGLNYRDHAEEQGKPVPERPIMFAKFPSCLTGPTDPIRLPSISEQVDPEAELCIVILEKGKKFTPEEAVGAVAGFMVGNDVSARDLQYADRQWVRAKSCDSFGPCGPFLVTPDEVGDPHTLDIELRLNGRVQQSSNTRNLAFDCYHLISYLSQGMTLEAGDIIFTGTPGGVGMYRSPQVFLKQGDLVEVTVEKLGTLRNPVVSDC